MILYIVRHAWAADRTDPAWPTDDARPLTDEGVARFTRMIETLAKRDFAPEVIATSPLVRCRQTAEIIAKVLGGKTKVVEREELAPGSNLEGLVKWTARRAMDCQEVAWVGHAPDVNDLTAALVGDRHGAIRLAKGAIAAIEFADVPRMGQGELRWLVTAKLLGC
jgi:phosphohistidine phosphatase